jgi:hypothetical protein
MSREVLLQRLRVLQLKPAAIAVRPGHQFEVLVGSRESGVRLVVNRETGQIIDLRSRRVLAARTPVTKRLNVAEIRRRPVLNEKLLVRPMPPSPND